MTGRKVFESRLGDVEIYLDRISRPERTGDWSRINSEFSEDELLDQAFFRDVEDIDLDFGGYFSVLKLKIDSEWRRMFFRSGEAEELYDLLEYRWKVYRENH